MKSAGDWITRNVSRLRGAASEKLDAKPPRGPRPPVSARPLAERLEATLRRPGEAMTPRALRRALAELQAVVDTSVDRKSVV